MTLEEGKKRVILEEKKTMTITHRILKNSKHTDTHRQAELD